MASYKFMIPLNKLQGASVALGPDGQECLCIPIEQANLFRSEKTGNIFLSLVAWENRIPDQYGNTHTLKQSFSKDDPRAAAAPILGTAKAIYPKGSYQQMPYQQPQWQQKPPQQ